MIAYDICFLDSYTHVIWQGKRVGNRDEFDSYLRGPVHRRVTDESQRVSFESDLRAISATGMASDMLEKLLTSKSDKEPWEIGEALAECLLEEEYNVKWPWNIERDKRTPKASLPGADLVGFVEDGNTVLLVLGEVKTSQDHKTPPGVMNGRSGMIHQLDRYADDLKVHRTLLNWLYVRCKGTELWPFFQRAVGKYLESKGRALVLFGMLMRDTTPHKLDLMNRAKALSQNVEAPTRAELNAWYFPRPIDEWPSLLAGGGS